MIIAFFILNGSIYWDSNKEKKMLYSKSKVMRSISIAVTVLLLLASMLASTYSVSAVSRLKVKVDKKTIYVGQTAKFKSNMNVKWSVSNKKIGKLTNVKKRTVAVKGLKAGTVYIIAKAGNNIKKTKIVVKSNAPKKINLMITKDVIGYGEYCTVFVDSVEPSSAKSDVTFTSSDKSIATVSSTGLVKGFNEGSVTITATSKIDKSIKAKVKVKVVPAKAGTITLSVDLSNEKIYTAGKVAKVWLPVPQTDEHQIISAVDFDHNIARLTRDSAGGQQLYIEWDEKTLPKDRTTTLSYYIKRRAIVRDQSLASKEKGTINKEDFAKTGELDESMWSGSFAKGSIVKTKAEEIIDKAGAVTDYEKAYAFYNWICDNMIRDNIKQGVIFGDVESMLKPESEGRHAGSCMDVNSVFVALCRAEGIPARNLFGLRFTTEDNPYNPTPNCRAEFYLSGYGWVVADPALAIKWGRGIGGLPITDHDITWERIKDSYWGNGEENWICVNMGRDIILDPPQSVTVEEYNEILNPIDSGKQISTINLFMFPYGEFDGKYIPCQDSKNFHYEYSYEPDDLGCGC